MKAIYMGRVQGVGFRYTARQLADGRPVSGYVKNLPDGTVELVAEGELSEVDALLGRIAARMDGFITQAEISEQPTVGFNGFSIRYG